MPDDVAPYLVRGSLAGERGPTDRAIAAYRVPYLPDLLSLRDLDGQAEREATRGVLDAQASVIAALARWQGQAFSLRYLFHPERGAVEIALALRADTAPGQAAAEIARMGADVSSLLARGSIPTAPVTAESETWRLLDPPGHTYVAEIRQREQLIPLRMGDAYMVSPWRPTWSTWLATLDRLVRQPAPCLISVHLQPTRLRADEREAFEQAASMARGLQDFHYSGYARVDAPDPQAGTVGAVYDDFVRRLTDPLLTVIQIASPLADTVSSVADACMRDVSESRDLRAAHATGELPCGADLVVPRTPDDALAAHHTLSQLDLQLWGTTHASSAQHRLRFLMDAHTAAAAFRFPLPGATGIPGVEVRASGRGRRKVFLSYRRDDSAGIAGRIYDRLTQRFGKDAIYMDVVTIPLGTDFAAHIASALAECAVQLAVIGPRWLDIRDKAGGRRLDDPGDYVRQEVEVGLGSGIAVIPILVDGATMPPTDQLPPTLANLHMRNGRPVRHADFDHDMAALVVAIEAEMRLAGGAHG